jgi:hypothetical protein
MTEHKTLVEALLAAKAEMPNLRRSATNPHFNSKFVPLDEIVEKVTPVLSAHGLVWMTLPTTDDQGRPALRYRLLHGSGELIEDVMPLCVGERVTPQAQGSALSYGRRYAAMAVLDLVGNEDDDGHKGSEQPRQAQAGPRLLTEDERARVLAAITDAGETIPRALKGASVTGGVDRLTLVDARAIRKYLDWLVPSDIPSDVEPGDVDPELEQIAHDVFDAPVVVE